MLLVGCKSAKLSTALQEIERGEYYKASQTLKQVYRKTNPREERAKRGEVAWYMGYVYDKLMMPQQAASGYMNAERYGWDVQGCGKEALKMRKDDYTVTYQGTPYLLDLHIKYGVSAQALVRVYFCWEETLQKLLIGYMPGHLATKKKST